MPANLSPPWPDGARGEYWDYCCKLSSRTYKLVWRVLLTYLQDEVLALWGRTLLGSRVWSETSAQKRITVGAKVSAWEIR